MSKRNQVSYLLVTALLMGGLAGAPAAFADNASTTMSPSTPSTTSTTTVTTTGPAMHKHMMGHEDMKARVEERIKTLHDKLKITADQESAWNDVAQAMRDNEAEIGGLIHDRHENATTMTAVEDLESYQKIAQAHADGMSKLVSAFSPLYNSMTDAQKANADQVFGNFEGHIHGKHGMHKPASK